MLWLAHFSLQQMQRVRPEGALAQGAWDVPEWVVWSAGALVLVAAMGLLVRRVRTR